jgi:hypothetical protein
LAFTYVFFLNFIFGGGDYLLTLNHIALICFLVLTQWKRRFPIPQKGILLFGIFISYILLNKLIHSFGFGKFLFKSEIIYILANFCLGYIFALNLEKLNPVEQRRYAYLYYLIAGVIVITFFYHYIGTEKYERVFIGYPSTFHDSYQTLSAYLARFLLVGIVMYAITRNEMDSKWAWGCIFLVAATFSFISLLALSKKETILFLLLSFMVYIHGARHRMLAIIFACTTIVAVFLYNLDITNVYISFVERSLESRSNIISEELKILLSNAEIMGSPFIYEQMGLNYPHSFTLSMFVSNGLFGVILSWSCIAYLLYMLWVRQSDILLFSIVLLIFILTNIATHFDYMVLWFTLGLIFPIAVTRRTFGHDQLRIGRPPLSRRS